MRFAQCRSNPARFALRVTFGGRFGLSLLGAWLRISRFALHYQRYGPHHRLVLAIGDVVSHGLLHNAPSFVGSRNEIVLDRPRTPWGERHNISDRGDRNQWARRLREAGLAGPGFVELPASNAAPFTEPNADWRRPL